MGKGDKRTKRGKIYRGSHGKTRHGKAQEAARTPPKPAPKHRSAETPS